MHQLKKQSDSAQLESVKKKSYADIHNIQQGKTTKSILCRPFAEDQSIYKRGNVTTSDNSPQKNSPEKTASCHDTAQETDEQENGKEKEQFHNLQSEPIDMTASIFIYPIEVQNEPITEIVRELPEKKLTNDEAMPFLLTNITTPENSPLNAYPENLTSYCVARDNDSPEKGKRKLTDDTINHSSKDGEKETEEKNNDNEIKSYEDFSLCIEDSLQPDEQLSALWPDEQVSALENTSPCGIIAAQEIRSRKKLDVLNMHENPQASYQNYLATILLGKSNTFKLSDLYEQISQRDQKDTSDINDHDKEEWVTLSNLPNPKFKEYEWKPKIINTDKKENGIIIFFLIHGTFNDSTEYCKDKDAKMSKDLINFSSMLADTNDCAVKIIPFQWSGELSVETREEAASVLQRYFLSDEDCMNAHKTIAFSHSYGGDVLLQFANLLKPHNKTLDLAVMAATPSGEGTKKETVKKHARILEYTDPEECFNIKNIIQCFSRGDVTQALGSRHMTVGIFNPLGTAERRLPFRISKDRNVVNCHFEHNGELCSHVSIKWHAAASMHLFLPMLQNLYPHAHDLNISTCDDNRLHLPIITLRNNIFSPGCETTNRRSFQASILGEEMFEKLYERSIGTYNTLTLFKLFKEGTDAGYDPKNQGREDLAKLFEKN